MKRIVSLFLFAILTVALAACGRTTSGSESKPDDVSSTVARSTASEPDTEPTVAAGESPETTDNGTKVLVAYFSATGTTEKIAEYAADVTNADLYEIVPAIPYTSADLNHNDSNCRANTEMNDVSSRPAIKGSVANMADYDVVLIGYPIWWGEAPRIVSTFMESYDFSGKTIVTFSTSGGSSHNDRSIKELVSEADWITGTRLKSNSSKSEVASWINELGLDIAE